MLHPVDSDDETTAKQATPVSAGFPDKRALTSVRAGSERVAGALGEPHLLPLLGQLVFAGDDLHCIRLTIALVLNESHRAVRPHLP